MAIPVEERAPLAVERQGGPHGAGRVVLMGPRRQSEHRDEGDPFLRGYNLVDLTFKPGEARLNALSGVLQRRQRILGRGVLRVAKRHVGRRDYTELPGRQGRLMAAAEQI